MGFHELKEKAKGLLGKHGDKTERGAAKSGEVASDEVGHDDKVDQAADKATDKATDEATDVLGNSGEQN